MSTLPAPRYSLWQAISTALAVAVRALDEVRALAREPGPQGERGERGPDGLGFDDFSVVYDGERTVTFRFARGDQSKEFSVVLPTVIDRGVWKAGDYLRGDAVTYNGSLFIAQCDTKEQPELSKQWRLAVKRGRDGKDGKDGKPGIDGKPGRDGKDRW